MAGGIRILEETTLSTNWGVLKKYAFEQQHRDGSTQRHIREVYDRGHAAVILLVNPTADTVILVRQFRLPVFLSGDGGWIVEACAGILDGDDPETCARKEAEEETGIRPASVTHLFDSYMSPGSVSERLSFFVGEFDDAARISAGGGLAAEGEDIEVIEVPFAEALQMIADGRVVDAKTIMLLQHVALVRAKSQR